jgi:ribonuclease HIII
MSEMANESVLEKNIQAFREFAQQKGWAIIGEREIPSGYEFRVTDGRDKVPVGFYRTGKASIQGKAGSLKAEIQAWWRNPSTAPSPIPAKDSASAPVSSTPGATGRTARFYVAQDRIERVKQLLAEFGAQILEPTPDPHQLYRAEIRRGADKTLASQFKTGTLLVQGKTGELFEEVCTLLEGVISQPFAERGARYVPDSEREAALEYLNKPEAEREALDWIDEHLGQGVFKFLPSNEREGYISGSSVLLWLKSTGRKLPDYSTVVMPFARAYEGFVIRLAIHLGIATEEKIRASVDQMSAGDFLKQVRDKIVKTDKDRYEGLADTLQSAWRDIRNKVLHSDPLNPPPHKNLAHAEDDIATLNRAMFRGYEYLVERGIIAPKLQQPPKEEHLTFAADTEKLREQLVRDGYKVSASQGAKWIAQLGDTKVICPSDSNGEVKVSGPQRVVFERTYEAFLIQSIENKPSSSVTPTATTSQTQATELARIGLDESGKGDYFGPMVIGAVYVDEQTESTLIQMGVRDSKRLSDSRILELAEEIKRLCPHSVVHIGPKRYNDLYNEIKNLNELLAWGHARALENVLGNAACNLAVADQFGNESFLLNALLKKGRQIKLEQRPKAEQDTAVAAASILARAEFVQSMEQLSRRVRKPLPKGSSDPAIITVGREIVKNGGQNALAEVAKLHFKTTQAIIGQRGS